MTSLDTLEQEAAESRARLQTTIDRIQDRLTLSGMVDEVIGRVGVAQVAGRPDAVFGLLKRHPLPALAAAAGVGFLMYQLNKRAARRPPLLDERATVLGAENDGRSRLYDPDDPARHPTVHRDPDRLEA